ncbi:MAG: hypothetical protein J1F12_03995 [Muribaculaceae bacterium]|nr:hypothetical protein [Muribaculaceae bacterium]
MKINKYIALIFIFVFSFIIPSVFAQSSEETGIVYVKPDYKVVSIDTVSTSAPTEIIIKRDSIYDPLRVVTNKFGKNWFAFATAGVHTFRGDFSNLGSFSGTLSPEFSLGVGKWFTPGVALKLEVMKSETRGYSSEEHPHYAYGDLMHSKDGRGYYKMKTGWWDFSAGAILNITRLIYGYEGFGSNRLMNQFLVSAGLGVVHHTGYRHSYGSDNELSAHLELQYSRFFTKSKMFSLDLKLRGLFYHSNHDGEYGQGDYAAQKVDYSAGLNIGFTFYLDKRANNGWSKSTTQLYQRDFREDKIYIVEEKASTDAKIEVGTLTFFVFYPNNYSGRNDAPNVPDSPVNALDYLAGGIFTQNQYVNTNVITSKLLTGASLNGQPIVDIPTEKADNNFLINFIPRGYEIQADAPMSLSLLPEDMMKFRERAGYYYAPIFDGKHVWMYRVDNATLGQQLADAANYNETQSFGLNSRKGYNIIKENMQISPDDRLVTFADVYAAINENTGYISDYTDAKSVDYIKNVLNNGVITMIQVEGFATSQDNSNGAEIAVERNMALSQYRASTVVEWLKNGNQKLNDAASQIYLLNENFSSPIITINDSSTRGLNAKLNRFVKVRIHYMIK